MKSNLNDQQMAQAARERLRHRRVTRDLASFARSFPSLVHTFGLAQAVALAKAKGHKQYLEDLTVVLRAAGHAEAASPDTLERATLEHSVPDYVRLSCNSLQAAGWLNQCIDAAEEPVPHSSLIGVAQVFGR